MNYEVSNKVMEDFTEKSREYVTPYMRDKLHTVNPEFTWDMESFVLIVRYSCKSSRDRRSRERQQPKIKMPNHRCLLKCT